MADLAQLESALVKADAAGDVEGARRLASAVRSARDFGAVKAEGSTFKQPRPPRFVPSGEKPEPSFTDPEMLAAHPLVRGAIGAAEPFIGAGQLAANATGMGAPVNEHLAQLNQMTQEGRSKGGSEGVDWWKLGGNLASPATLGAAKMIPNAASTTGRIGQGAMAGGAFGAAQPVYDPEDYWSTKAAQTAGGAVAGAAVPAAWEGSKMLGRGVRNVAQPYMGQAGADKAAGRLANMAAGDKQAALIAELKKAQPTIPGSQPTAGQAGVPAGSAEFSALQKVAADRAPSTYYGPQGIEGKQNAARVRALQTVGKSPAAIKTAEDARTATTTPMREAALGSFTPVGGANIVGVSTQKLIRQIRGVESQPGIRASDVVSKSLASVKEKIAQFTNKDGFINAKDLYTIRKEVGNTIQTYAKETGNWDKRLTSGLERDLQRNIDDAIEAAGGKGWKNYLSTYASMSKPINQMEIGQDLERKLVPALGEDAKQRASVYANALREGPQTIKLATGQPRFDALDQVMEPQQMATLKAVQGDLSNDATMQAMASKGMKAAQERIGQAVPEAPAPGFFSPIVSAARAGYNRVTGAATNKILDDLTKKMQSPQDMARLMENAKPLERKALIDALMRYQGAVGPSLATQENEQ